MRAILYDGPSAIDGKRIVALACRGNPLTRKTGPAIQTYIFRASMTPTEAAKSGADVSVCGSCPLRPIVSGVCYVELGKGAFWAYDAWKRGRYSAADLDAFAGEYVRIGSYGDPAAAPLSVWLGVTERARNWSGYTHQWRLCDQGFRDILMASVDSESEAAEAQAMGWRTFRLRQADEPLLAGEIVCPSSVEGGERRQCRNCGACRGRLDSPAARSVAIAVHGRPWKAAQLSRLIEGDL